MADKILTIPDLDAIESILTKYHFPKNQWDQLGLKLGLYETTIGDIKASNPLDPARSHTATLSKWLRRGDGVDSKGKPSWKSLVMALREMKCVSTAKGIEKEKGIQWNEPNTLPVRNRQRATTNDQLLKVQREVFIANFVAIKNCIENNLDTVLSELFRRKMITNEVRKKNDVNVLMNDLMNRLGVSVSLKLFNELCSIIRDEVSEELAITLESGVNEKLGFEYYQQQINTDEANTFELEEVNDSQSESQNDQTTQKQEIKASTKYQDTFSKVCWFIILFVAVILAAYFFGKFTS